MLDFGQRRPSGKVLSCEPGAGRHGLEVPCGWWECFEDSSVQGAADPTPLRCGGASGVQGANLVVEHFPVEDEQGWF